MGNIQVGFITPDNININIDYFEVEDFCKSLCLQNQFQEEFQEFSKNYTYFKPYFDFVMIRLGYVFINPLMQKGVYLKAIGNSFYKIEEMDLIDFCGSVNYEAILDMAKEYQKTRYSHLVACSDSELHIKLADVGDPYNIMLDPNGYSMISNRDEKNGNHEITSNTIVNQLLINNQYLVEDYNPSIYTVIYLIQKFGFVRATSLEYDGLLIGIKRFLTEKQEKYCDLCEEKGGCFIEYDESFLISGAKEEYKIRR